MVVGDTAKSYTRNTENTDDMWNYGVETWCNLEGQYVFIVADLNNLSSEGSYEQTICSLGIMGVQYVHSTKEPPKTLEVLSEGMHTLQIENISAAQTIGNTLDIVVKQQDDSELSWVTLRQGDPTEVQLSFDGLSPGDYLLNLQSFDNNSVQKSILKTDTITIKVH